MKPEHETVRPGMEDPPHGEIKKHEKSLGPESQSMDKASADPRSSEFKKRGKNSGVAEFIRGKNK